MNYYPRNYNPDHISECKGIYLSVVQDIRSPIKSKSDLLLALQYSGRNPTNSLLNKFWRPGTDSISFETFLDICAEIPPCTHEDLINAFHNMKIHSRGMISKRDLINELSTKGQKISVRDIETIIDKLDITRDDKIDYKRLCLLLTSNVNDCKMIAKQNARQSSLSRDEARFSQGSFGNEEDLISERGMDRKSSTYSCVKSNDGDDVLILKQRFECSYEAKRPQNLMAFSSQYTRRGFFMFRGIDESNAATKLISCHSYDLKLPQSCTVYIAIRPLKANLKTLEIETKPDLSFLILKDKQAVEISTLTGKDGTSESVIRLESGQYRILPFTSRTKFRPLQRNSDGSVPLLSKGRNGSLILTDRFKEALSDIFTMCDLDCQGKLDREEFSLFSSLACGATLTDELWQKICEMCKSAYDGKVSLEDFWNIHLEEAKQDKGNTDNLWNTLSLMGFNSQLKMVETYPFELDVCCQGSRFVEIKPAQFDDEDLEEDLFNPFLTKHIVEKGEKMTFSDISMHTLYSYPHVFIVIKGGPRKKNIRFDCKKSKNLIFENNDPCPVFTIKPRSQQIAFHASALNLQLPIEFYCEAKDMMK